MHADQYLCCLNTGWNQLCTLLPTSSSCRAFTHILPAANGKGGEHGYHVVDNRKMLGKTYRQLIVDRALATTEQDNEAFLRKFEQRIKE